ncbi:hypothetical protein ASPACDRAFT_81318 [Aspergillus aculeatus ATCC 16872]|uniref:WSC domain-containing protein n=1 Tax=Aspergillus aculeatus (strain ATCC 16872 / CBS 172.66 / WB 5094) TaxID=690307 RepID=A0A1L9WKJ8_ASPA1|nr:uncharacterized protein ASPACDRAFT_81318 [Aspergillus aculeatus ATCC 16872]OJJ96678.1 hypothetical protein ASPACDRAFT_81318 [Aspergillus aculeatus ATCC 16872]
MKSTVYSLAALLPLILPTQADDLWAQVSCFTSIGNMENMGSYEFQSVGHCTTQCEEINGVFAAVQAELCYCGTAALDIQDMALADDDSACNAACPGYAVDTCGGDGVYSLWVSQEYALSLNDDDDDDNGDYGYDYEDEDSDLDGDENEDGEDSNNDSYSGWNNTSTAVTTTTASSTTALNAVSTSPSVSGLTSPTIASVNQTATGSAAITTTTSTSGASRRSRILFF